MRLSIRIVSFLLKNGNNFNPINMFVFAMFLFDLKIAFGEYTTMTKKNTHTQAHRNAMAPGLRVLQIAHVYIHTRTHTNTLTDPQKHRACTQTPDPQLQIGNAITLDDTQAFNLFIQNKCACII